MVPNWRAQVLRAMLTINDITTDVDDPPQFSRLLEHPRFRGRQLRWPGRFKATQQRAYPDLGPLHLEGTADEAFAVVAKAAREMPGWVITREDPEALELEATHQTRLLRFVDDVVLRVRPEADGARVDMRSRSRVGRGDGGVNAGRIRAFWRTLSA